MTYTAATSPRCAETPEQLRARIPGWGVDLDPADRPVGARELQFDPDRTGAHWEFPERQPETCPRERSIEHAFLTPGLRHRPAAARACPGAIRQARLRAATARAGPRTGCCSSPPTGSTPWESHLRSFAHAAPGQPGHRDGRAGRVHPRTALAPGSGKDRTDRQHQALDPVIVAGPWLLAGWVATKGARRLVRAVRRA